MHGCDVRSRKIGLRCRCLGYVMSPSFLSLRSNVHADYGLIRSSLNQDR